MATFLGRARRWWRGANGERLPTIPFEVACGCGQLAAGLRQTRSQVVPCAGCGRALFVLPRSAYPSPEATADRGVVPESCPPIALRLRPYRLPLVAAVLTLAGVVLCFVLVLPRLGRPGSTSAGVPARAAEIRALINDGRRALAEGSFHVALEQLSAAGELRREDPEALSPAEGRQLQQLEREAALLAALLRNSLQEILHQADSVRGEQEWHAQFRANYQGRAVIFDDVVRREADGRCSLTVYRVRVGDVPVRLELGELALLQALPLDPPQRLLFGARLASVKREEPGGWVIRFRPDSGVLLTDPDAAAACAPLPLEELRPVLRRQAEWAAELP